MMSLLKNVLLFSLLAVLFHTSPIWAEDEVNAGSEEVVPKLLEQGIGSSTSNEANPQETSRNWTTILSDRARPLIDAFNEKVLPRVPDPIKAHLSCKSSLYKVGAIIAAPLVMRQAAIMYYNWDYREGEWENQGETDFPVWVPKMGKEFQVDERVTRYTRPKGWSLWVHDNKNNYGKVYTEGNALVYKRGDQIVARTEEISPYGRPYDKNIPTQVQVTDTQGKKIGSIEEHSDEVKDGVHEFSFVLKDELGNVVASTTSLQEKSNSKPLKSPWTLNVLNGDSTSGELERKNRLFTRSYQWKLTEAGKQVTDPRLLVLLSAYKSYVEGGRR